MRAAGLARRQLQGPHGGSPTLAVLWQDSILVSALELLQVRSAEMVGACMRAVCDCRRLKRRVAKVNGSSASVCQRSFACFAAIS